MLCTPRARMVCTVQCWMHFFWCWGLVNGSHATHMLLHTPTHTGRGVLQLWSRLPTAYRVAGDPSMYASQRSDSSSHTAGAHVSARTRAIDMSSQQAADRERQGGTRTPRSLTHLATGTSNKYPHVVFPILLVRGC